MNDHRLSRLIGQASSIAIATGDDKVDIMEIGTLTELSTSAMLPTTNHLSRSCYVVELTFAEMMTTTARRNPLAPVLGHIVD